MNAMDSIYKQRDYQWSNIDTATMAHINTSSEMCALFATGCLDAPNEIPAGSMSNMTFKLTETKIHHFPIQKRVVRGRSLIEQQQIEKIAEELINEILQEEANSK